MLRYFSRLFAGVFLLLFVASSTIAPVFSQGFSARISPGQRTLELERGQTFEFPINYLNQLEQPVKVMKLQVSDFFTDGDGRRVFVEEDAVLDPEQSLAQWIDTSDTFEVEGKKEAIIPVTIRVPENASYGDHNAYIAITDAVEAAQSMLGINVELGTSLTVKVLGGDASLRDGNVEDFTILTREKARNTVSFEYFFTNLGVEFFKLDTVVEIYEVKNPAEGVKPIKVLSKNSQVFPNVRSRISLPLGDLGDDYGEKEYFARVKVVDMSSGLEDKVYMQDTQAFYYNLPLLGAKDDGQVLPPPVVQKQPVVVQMPMVEVVKELIWYIGGFLVVLLVLIRLLFFPSGSSRKKGSRKKK